MFSVEDEGFQFLLWWSNNSLFLLYNSPVFRMSKRALRDIPKKGCEGDYYNAGKKNCWAISPSTLHFIWGQSRLAVPCGIVTGTTLILSLVTVQPAAAR